MYPDWLDRNEYPFEAKIFELSDGQMHYLDEGKGPTIVFLHGTPEWSFAYRHLVKDLRQNYRCIVPDHLGFGLSDKKIEADYAPEKQAQRLELFLNALELTDITLCVHDFAGPIGLAYAQRHPQKIKNLIIMNTWLWGVKNDPKFSLVSRFLHTALGRYLYLQRGFSVNVMLKSSFGDNKPTAATFKHYQDALATPESRLATWTYAKSFIQSDHWFASLWENKELLKDIPAQFIWGMKDSAFTKKDLQRLETIFTQSQTHELASTGHSPHEEYPKEVSQVIQFFLQGNP